MCLQLCKLFKKEKDKIGLERFPDILYKYYSYNTMYNENRLRGELFFSSPIHFNDVFDAQHEIINNSDKINVRDAINRLKEIGFDNPEDVLKTLRNGSEQSKDKCKMEVRHRQIEHVGILCLTNSPLNLLMWAYYGNNEGYCIEYDMSKLRDCIGLKLKELNLNPQKRCRAERVSYLNSLPSAPLFFEEKNNINPFNKYFCKAKAWEHENEYRIAISLGGDMSIQIDNIVKSITLGYNMSIDNKLLLVSKLTNFPSIKIYFLGKLRGTDGFERIPFRIRESEKENIAEFRMHIEESSNR